MVDSTDIILYESIPEVQEINPQFKSLKKWIKLYLGPATAELHRLMDIRHSAIKDENRNAIIPNLNISINDRLFYLSVKGCGAYEDMFFGGTLTPSKLKASCHDSQLIAKLDRLSTGLGFIMGESWMGESPYGAQGKINAYDELNYSMTASKDSINGAHLCPVIGVVQLSNKIEELARKFFWFRTYQDHFFQVIRLVPSNIRLYFESNLKITNPGSIFSLFDVNDDKEIEKFELNFIKSGIALLSLYSRSAKVSGNDVTGITYQDVWFDKDCVVAPDGTIYFADIEGLVWKKVPIEKMVALQKKEWQKLFYEFIYALFKIDSYRHKIQQREVNWSVQREELALLIHQALNKDLFTYLENKNNNLIICIEGDSLPLIELPILEMVNYI
ncbi:MAG: hypothetical protein ACFFCI_20475 [Promethearchaeota archaeon]